MPAPGPNLAKNRVLAMRSELSYHPTQEAVQRMGAASLVYQTVDFRH